jgi:hypothetical protein
VLGTAPIATIVPFPDQDTIWHDMVQAKYRSKHNLTKAYEKICIDLKDIPKMAFSTIVETFISNVLQMGTQMVSQCVNI